MPAYSVLFLRGTDFLVQKNTYFLRFLRWKVGSRISRHHASPPGRLNAEEREPGGESLALRAWYHTESPVLRSQR